MTDILVTGGTGFIGSNLVKELIHRGRSVRVFDNNTRGSFLNLESVLDKVEIYHGDIRSFQEVQKAVKGIKTVFHLAFINGTENFYNLPGLVLDVGLRGHLNIMDACKDASVDTFVYSSSSEIYQTPSMIPTPENIVGSIPDVTNPRYSYAGSKLVGELLTLHYCTDLKMKRIIFRPHNIYGPAMGFEHVIPQLVRKICIASDHFQKTEAEIELQGSGDETRAFCYIEDAIDGILIAGKKGKNFDIFNVGSQKETKIRELTLSIGRILNIKLKISPGKLQKGSTRRRCPDITKLSKLGYTPKVSLEAGLVKTVQWYKGYYLDS